VPGSGNKSEGRFNRRRADKTARMQYGNYPIALFSIRTNRQPDEFIFPAPVFCVARHLHAKK
jgi:hypothetical protein